MPYGIIKIDTVTFTDAGVDKSVSISGLVQNPTFSGNVTVTGTLSGVTVTGTTANFTSGNFTNISGGTHTITSGVFAAGSAASPSITFTGDLNTGIYSPGADQVAISTGGSGRLFVDASGNVGIGTSSLTSGAGRTYLTLGGTTLGSIALKNASNAEVLYIQTGSASVDHYMSVAGYQAFWTNNQERLRITSAGLVGVGTSTPGVALDVNGAIRSNDIFTLFKNGTDAFYIGAGTIITGGASTDVAFRSNQNGSILFSTNGSTERLRITSAGLVGVGTSAPSQALSVVGNVTVGDTAQPSISLRCTTNAGNPTLLSSIDSFSTPYGAINARIAFRGGDAGYADLGRITFQTKGFDGLNDRIAIASDGKVGIGTTSPSYLLDVAGNAGIDVFGGNNGVNYLTLRSGYTPSQTGGIGFQCYQGDIGSYDALAIYGYGGVRFNVNGSERARIDSSGRLLVGTSTSRSVGDDGQSPLQISGTGYGGISIVNNRNDLSGPAVVLAKNRSGSVGGSTIVQNGDSIGNIIFAGADGTDLDTPGAYIQCFVDGTPGANDMPGRLVFSTTADGASSPTERLRITSAGLVGIGTSSPSYTLDVATNIRAFTSSFKGGSGSANMLFAVGGNAGELANPVAEIRGYDRYSARNLFDGDLAIHTLSANSSTEKVRIDYLGRVGIGTTSPRQALTFGSLTSSSTSTPDCIDLGATYTSTSASTNLKFKLYVDSSGNTYGFTVNGSSQLEYYAGTVSSPGNHVFLTGGSERARIDSSGRLLVGTSSSIGSSTGNYIIQGAATGAGGGAFASLGLNFSPDAAGYILGGVEFNSLSTSWRAGASIVGWSDGVHSSTSRPSRLVFSTTADGASSPTERWRISSGGTLYSANQSVSVGTDNAIMSGGGRFTAHGDFFNGTPAAAFSTTNDTNGAIYIQFGNSAGTRIGSITRASSTTIAYNTSSDYRLKENFESVPEPIQRLKQIKPCRFNFKGYPDERMDGFIAHELQEVIPEAVTGKKDAVNPDGSISPQGVDQSKLVPLLTAALQEAIGEIESLKARVAALESA